jgi:hypothetical protein
MDYYNSGKELIESFILQGKQESPSWKVLIEKARMMKTSMNTWRGCSRVMGDIRDFQVSKGDHLHRKNIFYIIG